MAKEIHALVKLQIKGAQANPAPPIGPVLGQHGVNIMEFCKQFNARTQKQVGEVCPVVLTIFKDKSFIFEIKTPPVAYLLKKAANIQAGSSTPNKVKVATLNKKQILEIAELKMVDLTASTKEAAFKTVAGTARSMGIDIVD